MKRTPLQIWRLWLVLPELRYRGGRRQRLLRQLRGPDQGKPRGLGRGTGNGLHADDEEETEDWIRSQPHRRSPHTSERHRVFGVWKPGRWDPRTHLRRPDHRLFSEDLRGGRREEGGAHWSHTVLH